ncbi:hypothetical protein N8I77_012353 [Diaporthe amygdali]|uniref:Uncharacterized protein n=1 Tax=Phomopsis amygdali TaxID=1214568 RepID=A0AAD9S3V4_PHOAM|nr:hypothetical protein N8I77_012353 [Diaporthe amygdali]
MADSHSNSSAVELLIYYDDSDVETSDTISNIRNLFFGVSVFEVRAGVVLGDVEFHSSSYDSQATLTLSNCALTPSEYLRGNEGDCATICSDPTTSMLPWNMQTCYSLGVAAMLVQNGSLTVNSSGSDNSQEQFRYGNFSDWDGTKIISDFVHCITSSCTTSNISPCKNRTLAMEDYSVTAGNLDIIQSGMSAFCSYGVEINADIAGPGVMTSYLLQICAVIFFWVLFIALTKLAWILIWPIFFRLKTGDAEHSQIDPLITVPSSARLIGPRIQEAWARASDIQGRLSEGRLYQATFKILKEFQEVQIFFIGAIQIATLATFKPKSSDSSDANSAKSFGAAVMDSQLVQILAVNSIIPLLLLQSMIQRGTREELAKQHKRCQRSPLAWYTFFLVWITVILSTVVHARRNELIAHYEDLFDRFKKNTAVDACGSNPNPMVYCNVDNDLVTRFNAGIDIIYTSISLLTIDFLAFQVPNWQQWHPLQKMKGAMNPTQAQMFEQFRTNYWPLFTKAVWFLLESALLASSALYLSDMLTITHLMNGGENSWGAANSWGSWSFGQLIAVMVWVPTLFKLIFYLKFGVEEDDRSDVGSAEHTAIEFDPLQGPVTSGWTVDKPGFSMDSQVTLLKRTPDTRGY